MDKIFLSYSYRSQDQALVRPVLEFVGAVLDANGIRAISGDVLGGEGLTDAIKALIRQCDALIAILTPNQKRADDKYDPHPWVNGELDFARGQDKPSIAVMHSDVAIEGPYQERERIPWVSNDPLSAAKKLVQTVGKWKRESPRVVKVMLLPDEVGTKLARNPEQAVCEYRLIESASGEPTTWQQTRVIGEVGGTFVWIKTPTENSLLEFKVELGAERWRSRVAPQFVHTRLEAR